MKADSDFLGMLNIRSELNLSNADSLMEVEGNSRGDAKGNRDGIALKRI